MAAITRENLPSKFEPFLAPDDVREAIEARFQEGSVQPLKSNYVFDAGDWVLKLGRTEPQAFTTPDTHLYRIRKAEKIRKYIHENQLEQHVVVPKKFLYWKESEQRFYVAAQKMTLSDEVATPASELVESAFKQGAQLVGGQGQALATGAKKRSLTPPQAKALAEISILGYTDLTYNNLYFTKDGQVAIIDTEPVKRGIKKAATTGCLSWLIDKGALLSKQSLAGMAKLKLYTDDPEALKEVEKVEKNHVLWSIAKLVAKISLAILFICLIPTATALIPVAAVATALKVGLISAAVLKTIFLTADIGNLYLIWGWSYQGLEGLVNIANFEQAGGC